MLRPYWIFLLFTFPATVLGQTLPVQPRPSDVLETTFQAMQGPDDRYTLAINFRNVSKETCSIGSSPGGTGVDLPGGAGIQVCYYCEKDSQKPPEARINIDSGESVHQTRSWKTSPGDGAAKCASPIDMNWYRDGENDSSAWLFSASLLKPICSVVVTTNFASGQFLPDTVAILAPGSPAPTLRWANDEGASYSREHIPLGVTVEDRGHALLLDEHACPRLFVRARDATPGRVIFSRSTRVDEIQGVVCKTEAQGAAGRRFIMDFDGSYALRPKRNDQNKGEYTLDVSSLTEIKGRYFLVSATHALHLSMVDGKLIRRNWGPAVQGVTVSLDLDKDVYVLGSDIPLHIALQNVDSQDTVGAMDPYYDPPGVDVELTGPDGQPVTPGGAMWSGHGFCHAFPPKLVFPIELTLQQMGFHPERPGMYTMVAVWRPLKGSSCGPPWAVPTANRPNLSDYLTVKSSRVTFRVSDGLPAPSQPTENKTQ